MDITITILLLILLLFFINVFIIIIILLTSLEDNTLNLCNLDARYLIALLFVVLHISSLFV